MTSVRHIDVGVVHHACDASEGQGGFLPHDQKLVQRHDNAGNDKPLHFAGKHGKLIDIKSKAKVSPRLFDTRKSCRKDIWDGNWFCVRHSTVRHIGSPSSKRPNGNHAAPHRSATSSETFASSREHASAIHRFQNIMVNGVSS